VSTDLENPSTTTHPEAPAAEPPSTTPDPAVAKRPASEARRRANRLNAQKSTGPKTPEGKQRSCLNATRHGILSQVVHFPEEELAAYNDFTTTYVAGLSPVGPVETQLANACADLQFRLHRLAAAEHNLFALGHEEHGDAYISCNSESHSALTMAETIRRGREPLLTLTTYESRLSRRLLQTLKQLQTMQAERRTREQAELETLYEIAIQHPQDIDSITPESLGFVCSNRDWQLFLKRRIILGPRPNATSKRMPSTRKPLTRAA
jgi:hypothetical protein